MVFHRGKSMVERNGVEWGEMGWLGGNWVWVYKKT